MESPKWMRAVLLAAAAYNLVYAALAVAFPIRMLNALGVVGVCPAASALWQCIGLFIGVWGLGYAAAALDPLRHWPVVAMGLLGKTFGPLGFLWTAATGVLPWSMGWTIVLNDLVWLLPFFLILRRAYVRFVEEDGASELQQHGALCAFECSTGETLAALSRRGPVLAVFLRHFGCTFCREALADLAAARSKLEAAGFRLALIHNGDEGAAATVLSAHRLDDLPRIADREGALYRAMGLRRARLGQLFSPFVAKRGFEAGVKARHGLGWLAGDGFRMPGAFVLEDGREVRAFRSRSAGDRFDFMRLAGCPSRPPTKFSPGLN